MTHSLALVRVAALAALLVVAPSLGVARAQEAPPEPSPTARDLFLEGQSKYHHGDYAGAVAAWEAAYAIDPQPLLRYNMAQAYGRMGRYAEELEALEDFVEAAPADDPSLADARARLAALRERVASTGILVVGGPEGARLFVDGEARGLLPRPDPVLVAPGAHQVTVEAEGYLPFAASTSVVAGDRVTVSVEMEVRPPEPELAPERTIAPLHLALWVGGGAVLAGGAAVGAVALTKANGAVEGSAEADQARGMGLAADVLLGVGAAAAATGLVLYLVGVGSDETPDGERGATARATPTVGRGHLGVAVVGSF